MKGYTNWQYYLIWGLGVSPYLLRRRWLKNYRYKRETGSWIMMIEEKHPKDWGWKWCWTHISEAEASMRLFEYAPPISTL